MKFPSRDWGSYGFEAIARTVDDEKARAEYHRRLSEHENDGTDPLECGVNALGQ